MGTTTPTPTKKITLSTVKSFIRKNKDNLFLNLKSSFDGMTDMVETCKNSSFKKATETTGNLSYTLGIAGTWFVGSSRDYFSQYEDDQFTGIKVYNCCGSFILAIKKPSNE